jgi:formylglycine-generating enzyme required for sulfatase activity
MTMKAKTKLLRASFILVALSCALALLHAPLSSAQLTMEGRSLNIKAEDGKDIKLYDRSYALVIGVSDYVAGWPKLPGVKKDIEEVARALERHGFQVTKVENPDSAQLDKAFKSFIDLYGIGVENRLLFYFAGHGHTIKQSYGEEMGYIVPVDAPSPTRDAAGFMSKAMDMQQMELYARRIQSKHALFLFDSCFSGALFAISRAVPDSIGYKTARPVRQFITSGSADEQVPDQSIFRRQFIEAIEGEADGNRDGYVTGTELGEFLQDKVVNYSRNAQHPQYGKIRNPNLDKGDFVFALPKKVTQPKSGAVVRTRSGIELVYVPPGEFMMGSENGSADEKPVHRVTIREGFYMGKYEVTQTQWQAVMGSNPSHFKGDNLPVETVSWDDAQAFIHKLNTINDGFSYRLPSEAEWEYACRAGTTGDYAGDLEAMAWYGNNSGPQRLDAVEIWLADSNNYFKRLTDNGNQTHPVGQKQVNRFGLYDMHGNVWEWCQDWYHDSYAGGPTDGSAWLNGGEQKYRVLRGGSWASGAYFQRSAVHGWDVPGDRTFYIGFRVVATART